jgi:hypothetical protein
MRKSRKDLCTDAVSYRNRKYIRMQLIINASSFATNARILKPHSYSHSKSGVQSELPLSVNAVFE